MTMSLERRGGGGYDTDLAKESSSELPRLNDDLVSVGAEQAGARTGGMARYFGREP
jgi:hypothetical protein